MCREGIHCVVWALMGWEYERSTLALTKEHSSRPPVDLVNMRNEVSLQFDMHKRHLPATEWPHCENTPPYR